MTADRRTFLAASALAATAPLACADDKPISVGFVGVGNRGSALLKSILALPNVRVAGVCDIKPDAIARTKKTLADAGRPEPVTTAEWRELFARTDIDAVVAAVPIDLHAKCYLDAIAAGKDLYGEKPMCLTLAECDAVVKAAKASDRIVQIGFQRRANPFFLNAMTLVHAGELGELIEGRIAWSNAWGPLGDWFGKKERSGDWMLEQACHNWDVLNWALKATPVRAMGMGKAGLFKGFQADRTVTDYYSAVVEYPNGVIVNIIHSWVVPGQQGKFNPAFNFEYTQLVGDRAGVDFNRGTVSYRKELNKADRKIDGDYADPTRDSLTAFVKSVRTRTAPVANVDHGRDAVLACLLVRKAVDERRVVEVKDVLG